MTLRTRICVGLLLLAPLAVYWQTVFHEYGFRDDYAHLRESREVPKNLIRFTSTYGRPIYGSLLVASVGSVHEVPGLQWLRFTALALLTVIGLMLWRILKKAGWSDAEAAAVGIVITLSPSAQIIVGWSIAWPITVGLLLSMLGFVAAEAAYRRTGFKRSAAWLAGGLCYMLAGLTYQPSALLAVVPLAAVLLVRSETEALLRVRWTAAHLVTLLAGLSCALLFINLLFAYGALPPAAAIEFEADPIGKLGWFIAEPITNALALFAIRDRFATPLGFWLAPLFAIFVIAAGLRFGAARGRPVAMRTWLFCLVFLPFVAHAVNLVAAVRTPAYRTLFALTALLVVLIVYSLRSLRIAGRIKPATQQVALVLIVLAAAGFANRHALTLIAEPQGHEWAIVRDGVQAMTFAPETRVYVIRPALQDRATERVFADEFGSLSSNSDWATAEMFKSALRLRFPQGLPAGLSYTLASGLEVPHMAHYDVVIDMRRLREFRFGAGDRDRS